MDHFGVCVRVQCLLKIIWSALSLHVISVLDSEVPLLQRPGVSDKGDCDQEH